MDDQVERPLERGFSSPWPLFVAAGVTLSELGIFLGIFPIAVGGLVLLSGSVAGILHESDHVANPWSLLTGFGVFLVFAGVGLYVLGGGTLGTITLDSAGSLSLRGLAIVVAGSLVFTSGVVGHLWPSSTL